MQYDRWQQTRILAYKMVEPYMKKAIPIYEFMPLEGDPSKAEQAKLAKVSRNSMIELAKKKEQLYKDMGIIKD